MRVDGVGIHLARFCGSATTVCKTLLIIRVTADSKCSCGPCLCIPVSYPAPPFRFLLSHVPPHPERLCLPEVDGSNKAAWFLLECTLFRKRKIFLHSWRCFHHYEALTLNATACSYLLTYPLLVCNVVELISKHDDGDVVLPAYGTTCTCTILNLAAKALSYTLLVERNIHFVARLMDIIAVTTEDTDNVRWIRWTLLGLETVHGTNYYDFFNTLVCRWSGSYKWIIIYCHELLISLCMGFDCVYLQ